MKERQTKTRDYIVSDHCTMERKEFYELIKRHTEKCGLSTRRLAKMIDIPMTTLQNAIKRNTKLPIKVARSIIAVLAIPNNELKHFNPNVVCRTVEPVKPSNEEKKRLVSMGVPEEVLEKIISMKEESLLMDSEERAKVWLRTTFDRFGTYSSDESSVISQGSKTNG